MLRKCLPAEEGGDEVNQGAILSPQARGFFILEERIWAIYAGHGV